jgi:hypothetical protein
MENHMRRDFTTGVPAVNNAGRKRVVAPIERDGKTFWLRVGAAFQNKDSSWNLYIDAMPFSGRLQLRDWDEPWEGRGRGGAPGGALPGMGSLSLPSLGGGLSDNDNQGGTPF